MEAKHTPPPWKKWKGLNIMGGEDGRRLVAACGGHYNNVDADATEAENTANADLICAVWELLEFVQNVASGPCCETPGCLDGEPACEVGEARALLTRLGFPPPEYER